jgi:hypothetical protein
LIDKFDPETDVVLPKVVFEKLCWLIDWKLCSIPTVLEWLTKNPQCKTEFINVLEQLDKVGFTSFCLSTSYYAGTKREVNALTLAKRALKHQGESDKRATFKGQLAKAGPITFTTSNGLACTLKQDYSVYGSTEYWATITCPDSQVHLRLNLRQITAFQKTAENITLLKRIRPSYIIHEVNGERHKLGPKLTLAVLNAIINGAPIAMAPLLASTTPP